MVVSSHIGPEVPITWDEEHVLELDPDHVEIFADPDDIPVA